MFYWASIKILAWIHSFLQSLKKVCLCFPTTVFWPLEVANFLEPNSVPLSKTVVSSKLFQAVSASVLSPIGIFIVRFGPLRSIST